MKNVIKAKHAVERSVAKLEIMTALHKRNITYAEVQALLNQIKIHYWHRRKELEYAPEDTERKNRLKNLCKVIVEAPPRDIFDTIQKQQKLLEKVMPQPQKPLE